MADDALKDFIEKWEGREHKVYNDTAGHPTVGIGFNLDRNGAREAIEGVGANYDDVRAGRASLTDAQVDALFNADVQSARESARNLVDNFDDLDEERQMVVVDMVFNLGESGVAKFKNTIDAIENEDWERAANEMEDSKWYDDVGQRAETNVEIMRTGTWEGS